MRKGEFVMKDCPSCKIDNKDGLQTKNTIFSLGIPIKKCSFCGYVFSEEMKKEIELQQIQLKLL